MTYKFVQNITLFFMQEPVSFISSEHHSLEAHPKNRKASNVSKLFTVPDCQLCKNRSVGLICSIQTAFTGPCSH